MSEKATVAYSDQVPAGAPEGAKSPRAAYVQALHDERASIEAQPDDRPNRDRRLADIDAELGNYGEKPNATGRRGKVETAVTGPDKA